MYSFSEYFGFFFSRHLSFFSSSCFTHCLVPSSQFWWVNILADIIVTITHGPNKGTKWKEKEDIYWPFLIQCIAGDVLELIQSLKNLLYQYIHIKMNHTIMSLGSGILIWYTKRILREIQSSLLTILSFTNYAQSKGLFWILPLLNVKYNFKLRQ